MRKVVIPRLGRIKPNWSKVQAVPPQTKTEVRLYKDEAPQGSRRIKGYFHSATDDSITLQQEDGQRHTLPKSIVRQVLKHRPFWKRYQGWIAVAASSAIFVPALTRSPYRWEDEPVVHLIGVALILAPIALAFGFAPKMGGIYNVPPKHRAQPSADKQSGAESKASGKKEDP